MNEVLYIVFLPVLFAGILFILPDKFRLVKGSISLAACLMMICFVIRLFISNSSIVQQNSTTISISSLSGINLVSVVSHYIVFNIDNLCRLILVFICLFGLLINLYSLLYIKENKLKNFYSYYLITLGASAGTICSDNFLLFLFFWGVLGITLYKLLPGSDERSSNTAKKTFILIGASDCFMILGIAILWNLTGTLNISSISVPANNSLAIIAFLSLLIGSFTKAGAFPFHTWVPDYAESAPASSSALFPASLDKLLGIYFLARLTTGIFILTEWLRFVLLTVGVVTIIIAVMMALMQHNYKRLLGFHAVSQVGYMIVGFGLGSLIGIAAGLFHMVNHALYKTGLMLTAGSVEYRTGKNEIEDLGGLSRVMPLSFITALVFALSISGIPPLNGFASKWMIYQGIIDFGRGTGIAHQLWIVWLGLTVLGSALTLASFIKFIGGIFLGKQNEKFINIKEIPLLMWIPVVILAIICIVFGVFATGYVVPEIFEPVSGIFEFTGIWKSSTVAWLILISIILGILIYLVGGIKKFRTSESFIGGEKIQDKTEFSTTEYYKSFSEFKFFSFMYRKAEEKWFDLYDLVKRLTLGLSNILSAPHSGILTNYAAWVFVGLIIMLLVII